jgi:dihydroneopterin aldolase
MPDDHDLLCVNDLEVHCVIGVYPEERTRPQPLRLDLALAVDVADAARSGALERTIDYARLVGQVRFVLEHGAFRLLETAGEAVAAVILASVEGFADAVTLTLRKPLALDGNGVPALTLRRRREFQGRPLATAEHRRGVAVTTSRLRDAARVSTTVPGDASLQGDAAGTTKVDDGPATCAVVWPGPDVALFRLHLHAGARFVGGPGVIGLLLGEGRQGVSAEGVVVADGRGRGLLIAAPPTTTADALLSAVKGAML